MQSQHHQQPHHHTCSHLRLYLIQQIQKYRNHRPIIRTQTLQHQRRHHHLTCCQFHSTILNKSNNIIAFINRQSLTQPHIPKQINQSLTSLCIKNITIQQSLSLQIHRLRIVRCVLCTAQSYSIDNVINQKINISL